MLPDVFLQGINFKKVVKALDANKNGLLEEDEFIYLLD